jgi:hypothetical protein
MQARDEPAAPIWVAHELRQLTHVVDRVMSCVVRQKCRWTGTSATEQRTEGAGGNRHEPERADWLQQALGHPGAQGRHRGQAEVPDEFGNLAQWPTPLIASSERPASLPRSCLSSAASA